MEHTIETIRQRAMEDAGYCALLKKLCTAERRLDEVEISMTDIQRDTMWDFFELSEEINQRLLEIALKTEASNGK